MGPSAYSFVDFLKEGGQSLWQVLPIHPVLAEGDFSPYYPASLFAGNPLLISPQLLQRWGLVSDKTLETYKRKPSGRISYRKVCLTKARLLEEAASNFSWWEDLRKFEEDNSFWLEDYAVFEAERISKKVREEDVLKVKITQYLFFRQWFMLKEYANRQGVLIVGDLPMYPAPNSADVLSRPYLFDNTLVAGVPPDRFNERGQWWGNPVYRWEKHLQENFQWWVERVRHALRLFDILRFDHFRGFVAYWAFPVRRWLEAPGWDLMKLLRDEFPNATFIAEDLGHITPDVETLRDAFGFYSSRVLAFAFYHKDSPHLPHRHTNRCVVYTTTHDLKPLKDWYYEDLTPEERSFLHSYTWCTQENLVSCMLKMAYMSVADLCIVPLQDVLGLGKEARMNVPGTQKGNWRWCLKNLPSEEVASYLRQLSDTYGRVS